MEVELKKKSKKSLSLVIGILLVLIVTVGISYGLYKYSKTTDNQQLVAGDIYMKVISNEVTSENIRPMDIEEGKINGNKYKFKVEGYNNSKKDIYYGIYLKYGEDQTGKERFKDEDVMIYLTETIDGETKDVFGPGRLSDFNSNLIYANTISGNISKEDKVDIDYELTVWLSDNILISDTETEWGGKTIYTSDEFANSYFSLDVEVEGDFIEKEIVNDETEVEAIEVETNKEYDIENHPMSDEDVKVIIKTTKEATKAVVTNVTESKKQELVPTKVGNYYQVEIIVEKTAKYNYYFVYKDSKISDTYSFNVNINPERYTLIEKPTETICIARTYNGKSQDLVSNDKEGYILENYQQKDAGSYQVKAKLQDKYRWSDKSQEDITINCNIGKKELIVTPDSNQSRVYGSEEKDLTYTYEGNLEEPGFTGKLGRAEGNDVGTYQINKGTLDIEDKLPFKASNYNLKFSETPVNFEITKSSPKLTLSSETGEVLEGKSVVITGTVSPSIGGTYTVTTSKEGIVTTKVSGNEIEITGVANGSVDVVVTFKPTDTKNYNDSNSVTYKVTGYKVASEGSCLNPTYTGASQALALGGTGITLGSNSGVDAKDNYSVTETLQDGYRWSDNTTGTKTLTCKINKKSATVTASDQTVTYGTGITTGVGKATAKDLVTNHTLGSVTLTASTKDVPGGKITPSNAKIMSGTVDVTANYNLSYVDGTLTINKKQITVTPNSNMSKIYGNAEPTIGYSNTGAISGENPVFTGKLGRTQGENVGTYPINLGGLALSDGTGFKANNYSLALASGTYNFTISQRETTITPVAQTITYGGKIDTAVSKATASNLVSGHSLSQVTLSTTATNVPGGKITASGAKIVNGTTDVTSNYKISYAEGTLTITKANVGIGTCADKVYNGAEQTIVNTVGGVTYSNTKGTNVNTYTITVKPDGNHKFEGGEESKTLSCKITQKPVTITAKAQTITYGGSITQGATQVTADGLVSGHSVTAISLAASTPNVPGGTITPSGATISVSSTNVTANYSITYKGGTLTINKATVSGPGSCADKVYNGGEQTIVTTVGGLSYSTTKGTNVNTYTITVTPDGNHRFSDDALNKALSCKITQKPVTITAKAQTITYGGSITQGAAQVTADGLVSGHSVTGVSLAASTPNVPGGTITPSGATISVSSTNVTANYSITYKGGTLTINKAAVSGPGSCKTGLVYSGGSQELVNKVSGVNYTTTTGIDAQTYTITATPDGNHMFEGGEETKTLSCVIAKAPQLLYGGILSETISRCTYITPFTGNTLFSKFVTILNLTSLPKEVHPILSTSGKIREITLYVARSNTTATNFTYKITYPNIAVAKDIDLFENPPNINLTCSSNCYLCPSNIAFWGLDIDIKPDDVNNYSNTPNVPSYKLRLTPKTSTPSVEEGPEIFDDVESNSSSNKTSSVGSCNKLEYNGEEQTLVSGGKNVTYSSNTGKEAGTYTVTAKANQGYFFNDGSTSKTLSCTIEKKVATVNYSNTNVKYTGGLVAPSAYIVGVNGEEIELETTKASEVGSYTTVATMKSVNPNYTLRNTVIDYKITKDEVKEDDTDIKTKLIINYYLMNQDKTSYTLVNRKELKAKEGESITGELNKYDGYITPKEITLKVVKGINVIDYYYNRV